MVSHNEALKIGPALYSIRQSQLKCYGIATGAFTHTIDRLFYRGVPTTIVVGLVSSEAYAGSYKKNFANFANYGLNFLEFLVNGNGVPTILIQPLVPLAKRCQLDLKRRLPRKLLFVCVQHKFSRKKCYPSPLHQVTQVLTNCNNNSSQFIMRLFQKVFKGIGYSITHSVYSVIIMQPAKAQDTITHIYNQYCRQGTQVPNLSPWWGEMFSQVYKPLTNQT